MLYLVYVYFILVLLGWDTQARVRWADGWGRSDWARKPQRDGNPVWVHRGRPQDLPVSVVPVKITLSVSSTSAHEDSAVKFFQWSFKKKTMT